MRRTCRPIVKVQLRAIFINLNVSLRFFVAFFFSFLCFRCAVLLAGCCVCVCARDSVRNNEGEWQWCAGLIWQQTQWVRIMLRTLLSLQSIAHHGIDCLVSWKWDGVRNTTANHRRCSFPITVFFLSPSLFSTNSGTYARTRALWMASHKLLPIIWTSQNKMRKKERSKNISKDFSYVFPNSTKFTFANTKVWKMNEYFVMNEWMRMCVCVCVRLRE